MAQRINVILEDDLDGGKAAETVQFGIDGVDYEIDVSSKNAKALRSALAGYVAAGRRTARTRRSRRRPRASNTGAIRQWAAANGYELSSRGRIPIHVVEAFEAAE